MLDWWRLTYRHDFILARRFEDEGRSTPSTAVSEDGALAPGPVFARVTVRQTVRKRDRQLARRRLGSPPSCHARVAAELELHPLDRKKFRARTGNELDNDYKGYSNAPTATQIGRLFHLSFHGARRSWNRRSPHARRDRQSDGDLRMNGRDERPTTGEASPGREIARRDRLIAVSGQADFDSFGQVAHPADARAQVVAVVGRIRERLERVGADLSDLAKLVAFHIPEPGCGEREIRNLLARALGPDILTTLTMVPLPRLASPGLLIAMDAYAMRGADGRRVERAPLEVPGLASLPEPFCHGLRCEEFIFTSGQSALDKRGEVLFDGDLPSQNRHALEGVAAILDGLGAGPGDIVKFNTWRGPPPSLQAYRHAAQDRFDFLAAAPPAVTGITIPETTGPGPLIRMDAWAMRSTRGGPLPRRTLKPAQHWDWPSPTPYSQGLRCGPWVFVGGQAALDEHGNVVGAGNRSDQTELVMRYVAQVLGAAGACFDDVLKLNTYYCHRVGAGALRDGADPRSHCFSPPDPALSDVPVGALAYPGMLVEIEAIAAISPRRGVEPR